MASNDSQQAARAAAFPELVALVRALLAKFGDDDAPEIRTARAWLKAHCRGCGADIANTRAACRPCLEFWSEKVDAGEVPIP